MLPPVPNTFFHGVLRKQFCREMMTRGQNSPVLNFENDLESSWFDSCLKR